MHYTIYWSIYIQCKNRQKLNDKHIPALEALIGKPEFGWSIEDENDDRLLRLEATFSIELETKNDLALHVIKLAYRLYQGQWRMIGLHTLNTDEPFYLMATFTQEKPPSKPPALEDVLMEVYPSTQEDIG